MCTCRFNIKNFAFCPTHFIFVSRMALKQSAIILMGASKQFLFPVETRLQELKLYVPTYIPFRWMQVSRDKLVMFNKKSMVYKLQTLMRNSWSFYCTLRRLWGVIAFEIKLPSTVRLDGVAADFKNDYFKNSSHSTNVGSATFDTFHSHVWDRLWKGIRHSKVHYKNSDITQEWGSVWCS